MKRCEHKNKIRLYERSSTWKSTPYYLCQDCGEVVEIGFKKIKPKTMQKPYKEETEFAFGSEDED